MSKALHDVLATFDIEEGETLPVVDFHLFFEGNTEEESIAPNAWGFGRPPISEIYERFKSIAARDDVFQVLVGMHYEWKDEEYSDTFPPAGNVYVVTSADRKTVEHWIEGLGADGVLAGWAQGKPSNAPTLRPGSAVFAVCWD